MFSLKLTQEKQQLLFLISGHKLGCDSDVGLEKSEVGGSEELSVNQIKFQIVSIDW